MDTQNTVDDQKPSTISDSESTSRKYKPRKKTVIMIKVPLKYGELDCYVGQNADAPKILGGRRCFEASIPVNGRSLLQNSLWAVWYLQIGKHTGQSPEEAKRECKLLYGVPILMADDQKFRRVWEVKFAQDTYEQKLFMMRYLPVTSLLSRTGGVDYTDTVQREYAKQGLSLEII